MDDQPIDNTLDRNDFFAPVLTVLIKLLIDENLFEDLAVVEEDVFIKDTDQTDAFKGEQKVLAVLVFQYCWVDQGFADIYHVRIIDISQPAHLEETPAQDECPLEAQLLLQVRFLSQLHKYLDLFVRLIERFKIFILLTFNTAQILKHINFLLDLIHELFSDLSERRHCPAV